MGLERQVRLQRVRRLDTITGVLTMRIGARNDVSSPLQPCAWAGAASQRSDIRQKNFGFTGR